MSRTEVFDLPFTEAIDLFRAKGYAFSPKSWRNVWQEEHARAFTVARVTCSDVLVAIRREIQRALEEGTALGAFKKTLRERLGYLGGWFAPKGEPAEIDGKKRLTPWRLEIIYRTNLQSAFAAGRYKQMKAVADRRPWWRYVTVGDERVRPAHAAMHGKIYHHQHPVWNTWYPPNGFG